MIIVSNSLTEKVDEGCLKITYNLIKRLKKLHSDIFVVTYDRKSVLSDKHMEINKLMLNGELFSLIKSKKEKVLYVPFPAKPIATAIRIFIMSLMCRNGLDVILPLKIAAKGISKFLIRLSNANLIVFSKESEDFYKSIVPQNRIKYIKTGFYTKKFLPVTDDEKKRLKKKYGFNSEKPLILHVGHLNEGRNIQTLTNIKSEYQVLLVVSTLTKDEQDSALKEKLLSKDNIKIFESYIPEIQEIYQMSDLYFFPVKEDGHCIDVPLSCLEAASCDLPVITTDFGEMKEFTGKPGFYLINDFEKDSLNGLIESVLKSGRCLTRKSVLQYDWDNCISDFSVT